jgi:WD40 repeat protein
VTAFDLTDNGAAFVSFFTNDKNEADEAAVIWWDGTKQQEVATLKPASEDCKFTSASITILPDGKFMSILGHRCKKGDTTTNWQLYSINPADKSATLAASASQKGAFAAFARSNNIYLSTDGKQALFSVPDGVTANTVGFKRVSVSDLSISDVIDKQVVTATYNGSADAFPHVSPDGKWLAAVVTTPNAANNVYIWSLSDPSVAPIMFSAGSKGDTISSMAFTPDSSHLVVIAGGDNKANNSLVSIEVATGQNNRVARGHFDKGLSISADGTQAALLDWQIPEDTTQKPYLNLVSINLNDGTTATLYAGADIVDGKEKNQRFAYPMAWIGGATAAASG